VVTNLGSAATSAATTVTDTLPAGFTLTSTSGAGWSFAASGPIVTATYGGLVAAGDSAGFTLTVAIGAAAVPGVVNAATASTPGDADAANDRDLDPTTVAPTPTSPSTSATPPRSWSASRAPTRSWSRTWHRRHRLRHHRHRHAARGPRLRERRRHRLERGRGGRRRHRHARGADRRRRQRRLHARRRRRRGRAGGRVNAATVATAGDFDALNDRDTDATAVSGVPDLGLDKRHTAPFLVGQPGTYTFVVSNLGSTATTGSIAVTDTLPAGLTFTSAAGGGWSVVAAAGIVTATHATPIAAGDSAAFTLDVGVGVGALGGVVNAATVATAGDLDALNDRDSDATAVSGVPDLALDKRHTAPFLVGQDGTYTVVVTNLGTAATTGSIAVTDTLPAGLTFASAAGGGWSVVAAAGIVTATHAAPIAAGDSAASPSTSTSAWAPWGAWSTRPRSRPPATSTP